MEANKTNLFGKCESDFKAISFEEWRNSIKILFEKISQNSRENICAGVSILVAFGMVARREIFQWQILWEKS